MFNSVRMLFYYLNLCSILTTRFTPILFIYRYQLQFEEDDQKTDFGNIFRNVWSVKRECAVIDSPVEWKRRRTASCPPHCDDVIIASPSMNDVITVVERLTTNADLVADGSRDNSLPTVVGKHSDLKAISPQTVIILDMFEPMFINICFFFQLYRLKSIH